MAHLKIQIDRCQFAKNSVKFLGHLTTLDGIEPNKKNIEAVTSFPAPAKIKDHCAFFDLYYYYQRFIKNCSVLAGLLIQSLKRNTY